METREYTTIDRAALGWPSGEWDSEPDKVQWQDDATGLPCLAVRHGTSGHWCGYVGVSPSHPFHGKDYDEVGLDAHGGLTFSDSCQASETEETGVCHVPGDGETDHVWWFGFDCAHAWDNRPQDFVNEHKYGGGIWRVGADTSYKTLDFVKRQCKALAGQLLHNA